MQDIADKAGVSRVTVSRVLSNHPSVKAETRKKVLYWVKALDYEPNLIAQGLAGNRTNIIGLLAPEIAYPFSAKSLRRLRIRPFTRATAPLSATPAAVWKRKKYPGGAAPAEGGRHHRGAGLPGGEPAFQRLQVPAVMITKRMEGFSCVYISHYAGGQQMAKHFLNVGFQRIGYIGPTKDSTSALKYAGFQNYLAANRIELVDVIDCPAPENMNASLVYRRVKEHAAGPGLRCEAYLANDDITACEAIAAFRELGYTVPQDIAIAGFDNSLLAKEISPKLTALAQPLEEIGKKGVEVLLNQISSGAEPQMYELESRVIVRESTINFMSGSK